MNPSTSSIRVLIIDPQNVVRAGLRLFLEQQPDMEVVAETADGSEALSLIETFNPDVLICDIQTSEMSGFEITRRAQATQWKGNVLIFTSFEDDIYINAFLKSGASGYLLKTASDAEIVHAVRSVHQKKSVVDPAVLHKVVAQASIPVLPPERLSEREAEILTLVARGLTNKSIALDLNISDRTVQGHLARIFEKLHATSRTDAVMRGIAGGLIHPPQNTRGESDFYEI
ncbi:MAG: response regulator transcription factor [Anaerolineae bacterium]|nr:response regulator transcription factor [Anaerolineae bacterium]